ncbi:MAG TPA: hypothetical protein VHT27_05335 [Solirubrobacteraceae bacterium]|jgi:hypothetical protein|nr:hypothetical protein [Solirubrobacteraceae bacterium]
MLIATAITATIIYALVYSLRGGRGGPLIAEHGYNNVYSDARAARRDHLG